jgi:hypothetical protein
MLDFRDDVEPVQTQHQPVIHTMEYGLKVESLLRLRLILLDYKEFLQTQSNRGGKL